MQILPIQFLPGAKDYAWQPNDKASHLIVLFEAADRFPKFPFYLKGYFSSLTKRIYSTKILLFREYYGTT